MQELNAQNIIKGGKKPLSMPSNQKIKRPYMKISSEIRSNVLEALLKQKLPIPQVSQQFGIKICTVKAILRTFETEGRAQKKTTRRKKIIQHSEVRITIIDPLNKIKKSKFVFSKSFEMFVEKDQWGKNEEIACFKQSATEISNILAQFSKVDLASSMPLSNSQGPLNTSLLPSNIAKNIQSALLAVSKEIRQQKNPLPPQEENSSQNRQQTSINNQAKQQQQIPSMEEISIAQQLQILKQLSNFQHAKRAQFLQNLEIYQQQNKEMNPNVLQAITQTFQAPQIPMNLFLLQQGIQMQQHMQNQYNMGQMEALKQKIYFDVFLRHSQNNFQQNINH